MKATTVDDLYYEDGERLRLMDRLVERLRDARARVRLGLPLVEELDTLLDEAAAEIEESTIDVGLVACRNVDSNQWGRDKRERLPRKKGAA